MTVTLVNFALLYAEALAELKSRGPIPFTYVESVCIGYLCGLEGDTVDGVADRLVYEIDDLRIPKFAALISWLSPYGMAMQSPGLIGRIACYALGHSKEGEEAGMPASLRAKFGL